MLSFFVYSKAAAMKTCEEKSHFHSPSPKHVYVEPTQVTCACLVVIILKCRKYLSCFVSLLHCQAFFEMDCMAFRENTDLPT